MPLVFAHHWLIELPIYLGPVIVVAAWVKLGDRRQQRRAQDQRRAEASPAEPPRLPGDS